SSSRCSSTLSAILSSTRLLSVGEVFPHSTCALCAALTALSTSACFERGTFDTTFPVTCYLLSKNSPSDGYTHYPPLLFWLFYLFLFLAFFMIIYLTTINYIS